LEGVQSSAALCARQNPTSPSFLSPLKNHFPDFEAKMRAAGLSAAAIDAFRHSYDTLLAGHSGMIPESSIQPVTDLPRLRSGRGEREAVKNSKLQTPAKLQAPNPKVLC
jgi:hypothetical protein